MEHLTTHLKDFGPWVLSVAVTVLAGLLHRTNKALNSLGETRFKADEAHEELCKREPEYERRYKTWLAHRKTF